MGFHAFLCNACCRKCVQEQNLIKRCSFYRHMKHSMEVHLKKKHQQNIVFKGKTTTTTKKSSNLLLNFVGYLSTELWVIYPKIWIWKLIRILGMTQKKKKNFCHTRMVWIVHYVNALFCFLIGHCLWTAIWLLIWCSMWRMVFGNNSYWTRGWRPSFIWHASGENSF